MSILYKDESFAIMGAVFEVYRTMGSGFLEAVYQECLELEFGIRQVPFKPRCEIPIQYKGHPLKQKYVPDFVCFDKIVIELKACAGIDRVHRAQLFNYLKITGFELGILVNFGTVPKVEYERITLAEINEPSTE